MKRAKSQASNFPLLFCLERRSLAPPVPPIFVESVCMSDATLEFAGIAIPKDVDHEVTCFLVLVVWRDSEVHGKLGVGNGLDVLHNARAFDLVESIGRVRVIELGKSVSIGNNRHLEVTKADHPDVELAGSEGNKWLRNSRS